MGKWLGISEFTFLVLEKAVLGGCLSPICVCTKSQALTGCVVSLQGALGQVEAEEGAPVRKEHLPTREQQIAALQSSGEFDVLVIGGGATGCGCALDAATRGKGCRFPCRLLPGLPGW